MAENFTWADYIVLAGMFLISALTGLFYAIKDRGEKTTANYFFGKGHMPPLPVGLSLAVSFVSGLTVMGYPIEVYMYGTVWLWVLPAFPIAIAITCIYFVPLFFNLRLKCVYEYLELRYNKGARILSSIFVVLFTILYMAVVVYTPAIALTALTAISIHWTILITIGVCTFYTVIGGFKSVIWTDTFQSMIMVIGSAVIVVRTILLVGGISNVTEALERGNRSNVIYFDPDPTNSRTSWTVLFGMGFNWIIVMTISQENAQRYLSCKSVNKARLSLMFCMIPQMLITFTSISAGAVAYAYFEGCDPVKTGEVDKYDQILPILVAKITVGLPGICGLFVATIYCATLSTVSSGINSVTVIFMEDFVPLFYSFQNENMKLRLSKICGLLLGVIILVLALLISVIKGTILQLSFKLLSSFTSPILGMFVLGMFFPRVKASDAITGAVCGFAFASWIAVGSMIYPHEPQIMGLNTNECNQTYTNNTISTVAPEEYIDKDNKFDLVIYHISFLHLRAIGLLSTILVAIILSFLTCPNDPKNVNPKYFVPLFDNKIFPWKFRKAMRFGVRLQYEDTQKDDEMTLKSPMIN